MAFGWVTAVGSKLVRGVGGHSGHESEAEVEEFVVLVVKEKDWVARFLNELRRKGLLCVCVCACVRVCVCMHVCMYYKNPKLKNLLCSLYRRKIGSQFPIEHKSGIGVRVRDGCDEEEFKIEEFVVLVIQEKDRVARFLNKQKKTKKGRRCQLQVIVKGSSSMLLTVRVIS